MSMRGIALSRPYSIGGNRNEWMPRAASLFALKGQIYNCLFKTFQAAYVATLKVCTSSNFVTD